MYRLNELVIVTHRNDNTIICNEETGKFIKITRGAWDIVLEFVNAKQSVEKYLIKYVDLEEKKYVNDFLMGLIERRVLVNTITDKRNIQLYWDITNDCNLRCIHCCANAGEGLKEKENIEDCLNVARMISEVNPQRIIISGGEPLVHPYFKEIISFLKTHNQTLTLMTNGTLIDFDMANFINNHFDIVEVSIDGINEETCSLIRGKGTYQKTISGIKMLNEVGVKKISASMLLTDKTISHTEDFKKWCEENGLYPVIRSLIVSGRAKNNLEKLRLQKNEEGLLKAKKIMIEESCQKRRLPIVCGATISKFQIDRKGNVYPCQLLDSEEFLLGNLLSIKEREKFFKDRTFKEEEGYKNFIRYKKPKLERCRKCEYMCFCSSCAAENYVEENVITLDECELCQEVLNDYFDK